MITEQGEQNFKGEGVHRCHGTMTGGDGQGQPPKESDMTGFYVEDGCEGHRPERQDEQ